MIHSDNNDLIIYTINRILMIHSWLRCLLSFRLYNSLNLTINSYVIVDILRERESLVTRHESFAGKPRRDTAVTR